jgi:penicillin-binding protein 1A
MDKVGPEAVVKLTHKLVKSEIPSNHSIHCIRCTVEDMVAAYSTFANQGVYTKPQFLSRIEDKKVAIIMSQS